MIEAKFSTVNTRNLEGGTIWTLDVAPSSGLATVALTACEGNAQCQLLDYTLEGQSGKIAIVGTVDSYTVCAQLTGKVTSISAWVGGENAAAVLTWFPQGK